jgi:phage terminase small subunit
VRFFRDLVASVPAEHFRPADGHLVEQYAQAIVLARRAYAELEASGSVVNGRASPWIVVLEKAHRSSVALAARLRLSPQHRTDPKSAGRNQATASAYQIMELQDDDDD